MKDIRMARQIVQENADRLWCKPAERQLDGRVINRGLASTTACGRLANPLSPPEVRSLGKFPG